MTKQHTPTTDLEYSNRGMFTHFYPNTTAGEGAWRVMAEDHGNAAVLSIHAKSVIDQLRAAGYTVKKAGKNEQSINEILAELGV